MPGKLKAKIVAGRHLPVMDRASDLTDAFVEVSEAWRIKLDFSKETSHIYIILILFSRSSLETRLSKLMSVPNPSIHSGTQSGSNLR